VTCFVGVTARAAVEVPADINDHHLGVVLLQPRNVNNGPDHVTPLRPQGSLALRSWCPRQVPPAGAPGSANGIYLHEIVNGSVAT
jgi:hypothetical protein